MRTRLLAVPLALLTATACGTSEPPPPSASGQVGSQVRPSLTTTTALVVTSSKSVNPFVPGKPCELVSDDEAADLGLNLPGRQPNGSRCQWDGRDFSIAVTTRFAQTMAQVEASRPGRRITVGGRRAGWLTKGEGEYAGLCDLTLEVIRTATVDIVLTRYDKNSDTACLDAIKVGTLMHPRFPGA